MADKRNWNATLNSKGLEDHVTEEQARAMAQSQGDRTLLIVDARHGQLVVDEDGTRRIKLSADLIEVVPTAHEGVVRDMMRALRSQHPEQIGQGMLEGVATSVTPEEAAEGLQAAAAAVPGWDANPDAPGTPEAGAPAAKRAAKKAAAKKAAAAPRKAAEPALASVPDA